MAVASDALVADGGRVVIDGEQISGNTEPVQALGLAIILDAECEHRGGSTTSPNVGRQFGEQSSIRQHPAVCIQLVPEDFLRFEVV